MARASYLIAKYVSDVFRNEPVNFGVISWCNGVVAFRFLATNAQGQVDGRTLRGKISMLSLDAYKQWIHAWVKLISKDKISFIGKPEFAVKNNENFLAALESTSSGNFILERGGELLEDVSPNEIQSVADFLFRRLVDEELEEEPETKRMKEKSISKSPKARTERAKPRSMLPPGEQEISDMRDDAAQASHDRADPDAIKYAEGVRDALAWVIGDDERPTV